MTRLVCAILIVTTTAGCAVTSVGGERLPVRSDGFAAYVELVFRRQNEVALDLGDVLDSADPGGPRFEQLEQLEDELLDACRGLNELAEARRAGEQAPGFKALRRARQAPGCEAATAAVEAELAGAR